MDQLWSLMERVNMFTIEVETKKKSNEPGDTELTHRAYAKSTRPERMGEVLWRSTEWFDDATMVYVNGRIEFAKVIEAALPPLAE